MTKSDVSVCGSSRFQWAVAIFTAREKPAELFATINAAVLAGNRQTVIDVMVNGNPALAVDISKLIDAMQVTKDAPTIKVWSMPLGGKAHAWNQYVHFVWSGAQLTFFVDGYARVSPNAFQALNVGMASATDAIAGTGLPSSGRSAAHLRKETLSGSGLTGAFFAIKAPTMQVLREKNIRLPLGLYGFDSLLGAILAFGLDPARNQWNASKYIFIHPDVTWIIDDKKWWRFSVVKTQLNRILNNGLRVLVVNATIDFLAKRKLAPEQLPRTTKDFVLSWIQSNPRQALNTFRRHPISRLALKRLKVIVDWSAAELPPDLIYQKKLSD